MSIENSACDLLSTGCSSFESLRQQGRLYVDKSGILSAVARQHRAFYFTRPPKFGKTLVLSCLESLFRNGLKYFQGLDAETIWRDHTWPVVHISFKDLRSADNFEDELLHKVALAFEVMGLTVHTKNAQTVYRGLAKLFDTMSGRTFVLLIDDYDTPLRHTFHDLERFTEALKAVKRLMDFFKSYEYLMRFCFITGTMRFLTPETDECLSHVTDISFDPLFGSLTGFTEQEVQHTFKRQIQRAAELRGESSQNVYDKMRAQYFGYCFDKKALVRVFQPWSVLNFLADPTSKNSAHWFRNVLAPNQLNEQFARRIIYNPQEFSSLKVIGKEELVRSQTPRGADREAILTQTGFFSIRRAEDTVFYLDYPNQEVSGNMAVIYSRMLLGGRQAQSGEDLRQALFNGDCLGFIKATNALYQRLDDGLYPVRYENTCRSYLRAIICAALNNTEATVYPAEGGGSLKIITDQRQWVLEGGVTANARAARRRLKDLLVQFGRKPRSLPTGGRELIRLFLVFSQEDKAFVAWHRIDWQNGRDVNAFS